MSRLERHPWPGNVRELENVIEHAFALGVGDLLQVEDLPAHVRAGAPKSGRAATRCRALTGKAPG
jgi:DNA-binding NtrC family response regulator